jgi:hypothetical protein
VLSHCLDEPTAILTGTVNLRFAFSSCVYGYPEKVTNSSNSCPVACEQIKSSVEYQLDSPAGENIETWCDTASFADNEITDCNACYNLTSDEMRPQVYLANCTSAPLSPFPLLQLTNKMQSSNLSVTTAISKHPQKKNSPSHLAASSLSPSSLLPRQTSSPATVTATTPI